MRNVLPDLATQTPLWLALLTVGVNAIVGALRASSDDEHHWDIVGLSTFAVLMGLGGGFIRDILVGNTPVESLRTPWYLVTVVVGIGLVLFFVEIFFVATLRFTVISFVASLIWIAICYFWLMKAYIRREDGYLNGMIASLEHLERQFEQD